jgi:hypothetical protein
LKRLRRAPPRSLQQNLGRLGGSLNASDTTATLIYYSIPSTRNSVKRSGTGKHHRPNPNGGLMKKAGNHLMNRPAPLTRELRRTWLCVFESMASLLSAIHNGGLSVCDILLVFQIF